MTSIIGDGTPAPIEFIRPRKIGFPQARSGSR
jgi:hypothetical protein